MTRVIVVSNRKVPLLFLAKTAWQIRKLKFLFNYNMLESNLWRY